MTTHDDRIILKDARDDSLVREDPQQNESFPYFKEHTKWQLKNYSAFTSDSKYPIYSYLFNISNIGYVKAQDTLRFDDIVNRMIRYSRSLWSDFYEENRFLPWMKINPIFFENAFFLPELYVHYDEENEVYELYIKCGDEEDKFKDHKFLNILTNETVIFSNPEEDLVLYIWSGRREDRYGMWFKLAYGMEYSLYILQNLKNLYNIRLTVNRGAQYEATEEAYDSLKKDLYSLSVFLQNIDNKFIVDPIQTPFVTGADLLAYAQTIYLEFDREISEFGRVANLNPKPERKTAGENYIAMDRQIDHLRGLYDSLEVMTLEMEERGWPPLKFQVNTEEGLGMVAEPEGDQQPEQKEVTKTNDQV